MLVIVKFSKFSLSIILTINLLSFPAFSIDETKTLAISEFSNNTGLNSFDNLQKGLADSLANNLAKYKSFTILERGKLNEALKELSLSQSGFVSDESAVKLGKLVGSQYIIFGSALKTGQLFQVSLRVVETETGKIALGESIECSNEESIINSINYLSLKTASSLGENIDKNLIEESKKNIESKIVKGQDSTWLYISGTITVIVAGIVTGVIIYFNNSNTSTTY